MPNCGEIICFCVRFAFVFVCTRASFPYTFVCGSPFADAHTYCVCMCVVLCNVHTAKIRLCCLFFPTFSFLCALSLSLTHSYALFLASSLTVSPFWSSVSVIHLFFDVFEGDLGASFIIGSANTKLDIKIDTTNDQ